MNEIEPTQLLIEAQTLGEKIKVSADVDLYGEWNNLCLKLLRALFGQASEPFLGFRFPGGGAGASSRDERIRNTIDLKLGILRDSQQELESGSLRPDLGWTGNAEEIQSVLAEFHDKLSAAEQAN